MRINTAFIRLINSVGYWPNTIQYQETKWITEDTEVIKSCPTEGLKMLLY